MTNINKFNEYQDRYRHIIIVLYSIRLFILSTIINEESADCCMQFLVCLWDVYLEL